MIMKKKNKRLKKRLRLIFTVPVFLIFFLAMPDLSSDKNPAGAGSSVTGSEIPGMSNTLSGQTGTPAPVQTEAPPTPSPEPVFEEYDISLMALGDNLMHMGIVSTGKRKDGTYDF